MLRLEAASEYERYRVIGSTVVRCAIQHGLRQVETGQPYGLPIADCDAVLAATANSINAGRFGDATWGAGRRIGDQIYHGAIWSSQSEAEDPVSAKALDFVVRDNYPGGPSDPSASEIDALRRGARLLEALLPKVARSALAHAHSIVIFRSGGAWQRTASSSEFRLGGTIFLSSKYLSNPWWVAEHLFHEALHQQMYDFRHTHLLLTADFDRDDAPRIVSLWNSPDSNRWDAHRSLAAFHVYVHLALLSRLIEQRPPAKASSFPTDPMRMIASTVAYQRAHYLAEHLKAECWNELGPAGKVFVLFYTRVLQSIDIRPPPPAASLHLLLNRYLREARRVDALGLKVELVSNNARLELEKLAAGETRDVKYILAALQKTQALDDFEAALAEVDERDPAKRFAAIRDLIAKTLREVSIDGYSLGGSGQVDGAIRAMVETSSDQLKVLLAA